MLFMKHLKRIIDGPSSQLDDFSMKVSTRKRDIIQELCSQKNSEIINMLVSKQRYENFHEKQKEV